MNFIVVLIGDPNERRRIALEMHLGRRAAPLAQSGERLEIIDQNGVAALPRKVRAVAVVFCRKSMSKIELDAIDACKQCGMSIIPVVEQITRFVDVSPVSVGAFNGFELAGLREIAELVGLVLEALGLQRMKRKIFISYARSDGAIVAQQLREAFMARWYAVFLDTVSIRPGAVFQEELLHELADSDVIVLLNSPIMKDRPYVQQEITFANCAGIGGVQVVWPRERPLSSGVLFAPVLLDNRKAEIENANVKRLTPAGVLNIVRRVAILRTRLQAMREEQIVAPIRDYAKQKGWTTVPYLGRHIELHRGSKRIRLDVVLGVPTSLDIECAFTGALPRPPQGRLVYDALGITNRQSMHLKFFHKELALEYLDPKAALSWTIL